MQYELFSYTELSNCALRTANKALKSLDFVLFDKMMNAVHSFALESRAYR